MQQEYVHELQGSRIHISSLSRPGFAMTHLSLPGMRSITLLAAAMVSQATPNTWKASRTLSVLGGIEWNNQIRFRRYLQHSLGLFIKCCRHGVSLSKDGKQAGQGADCNQRAVGRCHHQARVASLGRKGDRD